MTMSLVKSIHRSRVVRLSGAGAVQLLTSAAAAAVATAVLGPHQRGVMVLSLTTASIVAVVSALGTGSSLRARLPNIAAPADRSELVAAFTWASIIGVVSAAILGAAMSALTARIIDPALSSGILPFATAAFSVGQVVMIQSSEAWFADGEFGRGGSSSAFIATGGLAGLLLMSGASTTAGSLLLGQALGQLAVGLVVVHRLLRFGLLVTIRPTWQSVRDLVLHGAPALGMTLGLTIALRADRYVLGMTSGFTAVGIYSLAATLSETIRLVPQAIGQLFTRDAAKGAGPRQLFINCMQACVISATAAVLLIIVAHLLIIPLFGKPFDHALGLLTFLVVAEIAFAPYAIASRGVLGCGWTRSAAGIGIMSSGVAILAYAFGARIGGSLGLAISCISVYGILSVAALGVFWYKWQRQVQTSTSSSRGSHDTY